MRDNTNPLSFLLVMTNIALVLFFAGQAHAQAELVQTTQTAAGVFIEKGVLGTLCVIEGVVIWMLFRELKSQHAAAMLAAEKAEARQTEWAIKATTVLTRVVDHMDRQEEAEVRRRERLEGVPKTGA